MMKKKTCKKCKENKNLDDFYINNSMSDGYYNKCIKCVINDLKERKNKMIKLKNINIDLENKMTDTEKATLLDEFNSYKLIKNRLFVSGDGGYKEYINSINKLRVNKDIVIDFNTYIKTNELW